MTRFKYLGEVSTSILSQGPCMVINVPKKDGTKMTIHAPGPGGFVIGADIGVDITDERSLRVMLADPRFQAI